ncbi:peroxisomal membrane protein PMP47B [Planoprotostelium fungivorum]|uniref:Peroxisomal membrane protein PMP47B n=1 Tax=Planoprotostelium fungivorum TaxID=1890364 RepID=A0A2P6MXJ9_9EUKA|nr:peroxisomal membrane protein PMP47B [Planoprotostelium fungivorum]
MNRQDPLLHALAGIGGGTVAFGLTYPLINISTRLQGTNLEIIRQVLNEEGWRGLFSGLSSGLAGIVSTSGVYYYCYEFLRVYFEGGKKAQLSNTKVLLMGAISGVITAVVTNPIWVINARKTTVNAKADEGHQLGIIDTAKLMIREEGVGSLWNGVIPAVILAINPTMQYFIFEKLKSVATRRGKSLTMIQAFWMGAIAKVIATVVTYPYIVVKSRLQAAGKGEDKQSTSEALSQLLKTEGIRGFYKGIESKILQSVLNASFQFMFKEKFVTIILITSRLIQMLFTRSTITKVEAAATIAKTVVSN